MENTPNDYWQLIHQNVHRPNALVSCDHSLPRPDLAREYWRRNPVSSSLCRAASCGSWTLIWRRWTLPPPNAETRARPLPFPPPAAGLAPLTAALAGQDHIVLDHDGAEGRPAPGADGEDAVGGGARIGCPTPSDGNRGKDLII